MKLLDLFCGAGGASTGYYMAGFDITGIDISEQPNYPFKFIKMNALNFQDFNEFDFIHASPPCQKYCRLAKKENHLDYIYAVRSMLEDAGIPWIIENIEKSPLLNPIRLCGSSFGLLVRRHRLFECSLNVQGLSKKIIGTACFHELQKSKIFFNNDYSRKNTKAGTVACYGNARFSNDFLVRCAAMGISWMNLSELNQSIPPVYTRYIGDQIKCALNL